jgi:2-oxoglutarate/2-oxoacid ferredoxin oxidoreductase subunit alpha
MRWMRAVRAYVSGKLHHNRKKEMTTSLMISGNEAIAEGALRAGCRFYAGYPITPQNELIAYMAAHMRDREGVFIQAESEIAAINMVFGASAAGARAMTSSSSPGISLKQEGISYLAGAELPAVIVNIMRGGPGLGNIAPAQSDYFQSTRGGGHGDYRTPALAPSSVQEALDLMFTAFDLAETYRTPVLVVGDGILGQMMEPVELPKSRKSALSTEKGWSLSGCGVRKPRVVKSFFMKDGDLEKHNQRLQEKYAAMSSSEQRWEECMSADAQVVVVAYGTVARMAHSVVLEARKRGVRAGLLRPITLWPFPQAPFEALSKKSTVFLVAEMSAGQMIDDVKLALNGAARVDFIGATGGGILTEEALARKIEGLRLP